MQRVYNFSAGPAVMPEEALATAAREMPNYGDAGMSVMEMSHRSKAYQDIFDGTEALVRELMGVPQSYAVLFIQGGATGQFAGIPMNLMTGSGRADFVAQYFQKGKPIEIVGSLHIDTVKNEDDTYTSYTYIRADEVNFVLSDKKDGNSGDGTGDGEESTPRQAPSGRNSTRVVRKPVGAGGGRKRLGL